jgi:hypothetical protein
MVAAGIGLVFLSISCGGGAEGPSGGGNSPTRPVVAATGFRFVDVASEAGIDRVVHAGRPGKDHLLDSAGTGAAWIDYDRDGWIDAYIVNGWKLEGNRVLERGKNALYRNRGDGTFEDVTDRAGVGGEGHWGGGVAVADYDGDGWPDILVTNFGPNVLYRNRGDGTFENVAPRIGVEVPGWNTGAAFLDADTDGDLDLYIAGYIDHSLEDVLEAERTLDWKGVERVAPGPFGLPGAVDHFFVATGDGVFVEATREAGLQDLGQGFGFTVRAADLDNDGDPDLYVANDSDANYFYRNEGDGTFREVGLWSGSALDAGGAAQAGMGVAVGDADGDGTLDILVTNFSEDFSTLYRGDGQGFFDDISDSSGVGGATYRSLSWGTALADLDNDGDQDLVVINGHIYPQVDAHPEFDLAYAQPNLLLENTGAARFVDATDRAGPGFGQVRSSRGLAAGDYDNDGDLDLLITHLDEPPSLLRNDSARGAWLTVICEVPPGEGTAIGTQVTLRVGARVAVRDLASSGAFVSAHDPRLHFGLGRTERVDRLEVRWPDGSLTTLENVASNRFLTVRKGS